MRAMASSKPTLLLLEGGLATAPPRSSPVLSAAARCPISTRTDPGAGCRRREVALSLSLPLLLFPAASSWAASEDEEYVRETTEVIGRVRATVNMEKGDPKVAGAVAELREASNTWVAKYRREKALLGRASFRDMYSALNAISGHYISFGPTAPIPAKRKARILEELDTAEKALQRGR
uniref:Thylakoid lumenal protein At1g03610, chloroplastic n=1 Tax=Anthurium amnicola TaxID=1678845 RepID=A0A1D1XQD8_9ARAE